jgi:hypothetical protein
MARSQRLPPLIEEVPEVIGPLDRGFDMDDAVGDMGVQPVKTGAVGDERTPRGFPGLGAGDADPGRYLSCPAVDEDGQVGVDVK